MDDATLDPPEPAAAANRSQAVSGGQRLRAVGACVLDAVHLISGPMNAVLLGAEVTRLQALDERAPDTGATAFRLQQEAYRCAEQIDALRAFGAAMASDESPCCELAQVIAQLPPPFSQIATVPGNLALPPVLMPAPTVTFALMAIIRNACARQASDLELLIEWKRPDRVLIHAIRPEAFAINADIASVRLRSRLLACMFEDSGASMRAPLSISLPVAAGD